MVTLQEQFDMACALARANEHRRIVILCTYPQFRSIDFSTLKEGELFTSHSARIVFPNGAQVCWLSSHPEDLNMYSGHQITTLFIRENARGDVVRCLQAKMRSSKYKGKFKTYDAYGFAHWQEWEQYGSTE